MNIRFDELLILHLTVEFDPKNVHSSVVLRRTPVNRGTTGCPAVCG